VTGRRIYLLGWLVFGVLCVAVAISPLVDVLSIPSPIVVRITAFLVGASVLLHVSYAAKHGRRAERRRVRNGDEHASDDDDPVASVARGVANRLLVVMTLIGLLTVVGVIAMVYYFATLIVP